MNAQDYSLSFRHNRVEMGRGKEACPDPGNHDLKPGCPGLDFDRRYRPLFTKTQSGF